MSPRLIGVALLLVGSEILGVLAGAWFYRLFLKTVPPLALSAFNQGTAHAAFLFYGAILGLAVAAWSVLTIVMSRFFGNRTGLQR